MAAVLSKLLEPLCQNKDETASQILRHRLASMRGRIGVAIADLRRQTESAAQEELAALERMLTQTPSGVPKLREQIAELESLALT